MKKAVIIFILTAIVIAGAILWLMSRSGHIRTVDFMSMAVLVIVVGFALYMGIKKITSARRGEPAEDELSRKIMRKTSSLSYYISLYLWLAIMYFSDRFVLETHTIIGMGILGMAIVFAVCWLVFNFTGIKDE
ncbi:MAG: hypothetical protein V1903_09390 [Bacteroidota bacterium]